MKLLEKIVLAYDFSANSKHLEETAIALAKVFHSKIFPIHVLPDDILNGNVRAYMIKIAESNLKNTAERLKDASYARIWSSTRRYC